MRIARTRTALLRTSGRTDVKRSGGNVDITGLQSIFLPDVVKVNQFRYRAEVPKVETIGSDSYTPVASTSYIVEIIETNGGRREGVNDSVVPRRYVYKTPADITELGATAALQREAIHVALLVKINADAPNNVLGATLAGGTGFTLTDDAGYYPAKTAGGQSPRAGATIIRLAKDSNNRGFIDANSRTVTTAAVYGFGVGSRLTQDIPVVYAVGGGNVVAGEIDCPMTVDQLGPVSGQQYDAFLIESLIRSTIPSIGEVVGYRVSSQMIFVDNGKGSATTNATAYTNATTQALGFNAFERAIHKLLYEVYKNDGNNMIEFYDRPLAIQGPLGAAPAGTANAIGWTISPYTSMNHINIGTQTIFAPVLNDLGLLIDQDDNAGDGAHYAAATTALCPQQYVVGSQECSMLVKVVMGDWTDSHFIAGFRAKEAYTADYNDYTQLAAVGNGSAAGDTITTHGILANAATIHTASAVSYADAVPSELRIKVDINGVVTAIVDNVVYPIYSAGTTALVFAAGTVLVPFYQHINIGSGDPAVVVSEVLSIADISWKVDA